MKEYVFDHNLSTMDQEFHVLSWFQDNFPKSPKKLIAMSRYIRPLLPEYYTRSICDVLEDPCTKDPIKWMKACIREMTEFPKLIDAMIANGDHGMIFDKGNLYPISLKTNPKWLSGKDTELWTEEDEREIGDMAVCVWMCEQRRRHFTGRYALFEQFGFSGIAKQSTWEVPESEWLGKLKPLRDSERARDKVNREISKLINGTRK